MNFLHNIHLSWFDIVLLVALLIGFFQGKKRGMSEELLDIFKWLVMVVVSSMTYEVIGSWMARMTPFNLLWTSIIAYIAVASLIAAVFSYVKSAVGKKVVGSDVFGGAEYVLGALSGMLRAFCVVLMLISVMNSMYVSKEKRAKLAKVQRENFGTISFPSLGSLQEDIFVNSFSGPYIHHYLSDQLMHPIKLEHKKKSNVATQREDTINNIIKKK